MNNGHTIFLKCLIHHKSKVWNDFLIFLKEGSQRFIYLISNTSKKAILLSSITVGFLFS